MTELMKLNEDNKITSLELVEQINFFRKDVEGKSELKHNELLKVIRDEFDEEIGLGEISHTPYIHPQNKQEYHYYELTTSQAKQVLVRESKSVRKAVIKYIEKLEEQIRALSKLDSYEIEDPAERAIRWAEEYRQRQALLATVREQQPLVELAVKRISKEGCMSITDVTKTFGLKKGALTNYAKEQGHIHKKNTEVNKCGEEYFKIYDNGGFKAIGVTEEGIRWVQGLLDNGTLTNKQ